MNANRDITRSLELNTILRLVAVLILATSAYSLGDTVHVVTGATNVTKVSTGSYTAPTTQVPKDIVAAVNALTPIGADSHQYDAVDEKGLHSGDGARFDVKWGSAQTLILKQDPQGTYCRGFTLEMFLNVLGNTGIPFKDEDIQALKQTWFSNDSQTAMAVSALGNLHSQDPSKPFQGKPLQLDAGDLSSVSPGDIMMLRRADGTAHCVIFLNWLVDSASPTKIVGVIYYSSQFWSTGCVGIDRSVWETSNTTVVPLKPVAGKPSASVPITNLGSGYGPRSELFDGVTFNAPPINGTATEIHGQIVPEKSSCFHFEKP